jgi:hypothetical protein
MLLISVIVSMLHDQLIALNYYPWWLEFNNFEKKKFICSSFEDLFGNDLQNPCFQVKQYY